MIRRMPREAKTEVTEIAVRCGRAGLAAGLALLALVAARPAAAAAELGADCPLAAGPAGAAPLRELDRLLREGAGAEAVPGLCVALREAEAAGDGRRAVEILGSLGIAWHAAGEPGPARRALEASVARAGAAGWPALEAAGRLNLGNVMLAEGGDAGAAYREAARLADAGGRPDLAARALVGVARDRLRRGEAAAAADAARAALGRVAALPASPAATLDALAAGGILAEAGSGDGLAEAGRAAEAAAAAAAREGWPREEALALGLASLVEERQGAPEAALRLARAAQARAAVADAPEVLFRQQRQAGRLLVRLGRPAEAIPAYRGAVASAGRVRPGLPAVDPATGGSSFRGEIGPAYLEFADLLLLEAERRPDGTAARALLDEARTVLERLKAAELEDYFDDDCVAELRTLTRAVEAVAPPRTAVIYPILLPRRLVLLVGTPGGGLVARSVPVDRATVADTAHAFRLQLESRTSRRYLPLARQLHGWLVAPVASALPADLATLVIVPDGPLRGIPFAALHDGGGFLIERFAVATAPGLTLLDTRPLDARAARPLLVGLAEPRQGFAALPHVEAELGALEGLLGGVVLLDASFEQARLERSFARNAFTVVHVASHGEFAGDPARSFLLTYDGRLDMDELERLVKGSRFRDEPVELITLSGCRTAAGDDRAALGLAGVAIKAGARSALASLWSIQDESSATLMRAFYAELAAGRANKAEALRRAQAAMLADPRYRHPAYWAAFLLIGNWV